MSDYCIEMKGISKHFGGVRALDDVNFSVKPGEIHSLVGANGAGKSTLIKILSGAYSSDEGEMFVEGNPVNLRSNSTMNMKKRGIGVIYQEFALAGDCSVAENVFLHKLSSRKTGLIDWKQLNRDTERLIQDLGFDINATDQVSSLSIAYQQVVEIAKAMNQNIKVLILDEPTAVLSPFETERLFEIIKDLKKRNVGIVYISHRLEDVLSLSDRITVMRDGEVQGTYESQDITIPQLIRAMIGRSENAIYPSREGVTFGDEVLRVNQISRGHWVKNVSFGVRRSEILGIAGLVGAGKTEMVRLIYGADKLEKGEVFVKNQKVRIRNPKEAKENGITYLSENRKEEGVLLSLPIRENVTLPNIKDVSHTIPFIDRNKESKEAKCRIDKYGIKCNGIEDNVQTLSGGNQQKVSLAKSLYLKSDVAILDEPTRGIDIASKIEIYNIINQLSLDGMAIVMVSSEMDEIIGMCDRVVVMDDGVVKGILAGKDIIKENILSLSLKVSEEKQDVLKEEKQ